MKDYCIEISRIIREHEFNHSICEDWEDESFEDAKTILKEIFEIPSCNGMDEEYKWLLTDDDLGRYSDMFQRNGLDEEDAKTECDRIKKDRETFVCACRKIKFYIDNIRNGMVCFDTLEYKTANDADITIYFSIPISASELEPFYRS